MLCGITSSPPPQALRPAPPHRRPLPRRTSATHPPPRQLRDHAVDAVHPARVGGRVGLKKRISKEMFLLQLLILLMK